MKKPNWNKWKYAGELSITEAVLLAMDKDPSEYDYNQGLNVPYARGYSGRGDAIKEQFHDLTNLATRAVTSNPPRLKFVRNEYSTWTGATFYVKDHEFAKWWKSIERELPAEFPTHEPELTGNLEPNGSLNDELSKAYKLIAVLVKRICDKKAVNQTALAADIEKEGIRGLGKTNINMIFAKANKESKE